VTMPTLADMEAANPKCQVFKQGQKGGKSCMLPLRWVRGDAEDWAHGGVWCCKAHGRQMLGCEYAGVTTGTMWFAEAAA
jgi:hypothetical protein